MRFVWASLVVVLCGVHFAAAQEDTDTDAARALFRRGTAQYEQKHYREALTSFEQAKSIKPLPAFDYNIARCHEQLAEWGAAADAYERYVDDARPAPPDAAEIRVRIDHLRQRAAPSPTTPPPSTLPPPVVATAPTLPPPSPIVARHPGRGRIIAGGVV
ncbi:MAG TPA: tetratricopeptide repeat protein, partial [Polyangia bacterium]